VGMMNSINFMDGLDGLSTGVSLVAALTLGVISLSTPGQYHVALLCAALAGALAGFLPWNFHPARVFIGTTGVFAIGYALAVLSILGVAKVAVALLVLGVPIIDTFWIIIRRVSSGHSPFQPDRGHFHHRLLDLGLTHRGAVLLIYGVSVLLALLSIWLANRASALYAFMGVVVGGGLVLFLLTRRGRGALDARSYPDQPPPRGGPQPAGAADARTAADRHLDDRGRHGARPAP
jgi:UDP-GlcNAc:undecaprenyl-phosphate GlcNAc-1-phosphate transferase